MIQRTKNIRKTTDCARGLRIGFVHSRERAMAGQTAERIRLVAQPLHHADLKTTSNARGLRIGRARPHGRAVADHTAVRIHSATQPAYRAAHKIIDRDRSFRIHLLLNGHVRNHDRRGIFRRLLYVLAFLFVVAGAAKGADAYYTYSSMQGLASVVSVWKPEPEILSRKKVVRKKNYSIIIRRNLFSSASLGPVKPKSSVLLNTRAVPAQLAGRTALKALGVRLVGTTVGPKGVRYAIFEELKSRKHVIYGIKERLEGALIRGIERGEVRLLYNGEEKTFRTFENSQTMESGNDFVPPGGDHSNPGGGPIFSPSKLNRTLSRFRLVSLTGTEADLTDRIQGIAYRDERGDVGVRVYSVGKGGVLRLLGLGPSDIIFEIDGVSLASEEDLYSALMGIQGQDEAEMRISRNGKPIDIHFSIR